MTSTTTPFSAPNDAFAPDPSNVGLTELTSPTIVVPAGSNQLSFKNSYNTESTYDGMVLEIAIAGGAFQDIITAGGSFVSGPYNGTIDTGFAIRSREGRPGPATPAAILDDGEPAGGRQRAERAFQVAHDIRQQHPCSGCENR